MRDAESIAKIEPVSRRRFVERVARLESEVEAVLEAEEALADIRFHIDGVNFSRGGSWASYLWKSADSRDALAIECRLVDDADWYIMIHSDGGRHPTTFVSWPTPDFKQQMLDALSSFSLSDEVKAQGDDQAAAIRLADQIDAVRETVQRDARN